MSAWPHQSHKISHDEAMILAMVGVLIVCGLEACAAYHFYIEQKDVFSAGIIITGWFKESIRAIVEHIF